MPAPQLERVIRTRQKTVTAIKRTKPHRNAVESNHQNHRVKTVATKTTLNATNPVAITPLKKIHSECSCTVSLVERFIPKITTQLVIYTWHSSYWLLFHSHGYSYIFLLSAIIVHTDIQVPRQSHHIHAISLFYSYGSSCTTLAVGTFVFFVCQSVILWIQ